MELNAYGMNKQTFEEDKELCYLVKQHLQLYNQGHKGCDQEKAWRTIADTLGKSVHECKARWEMLSHHNAYLCAIKPNGEQNGLSRIFNEIKVDEKEKEKDNEDYLDNQSGRTNHMNCSKFNNCIFGDYFG